MANLGGAPKCPRCAKSVYFAEEVNAKGRTWHKQCLTCGICKKKLDSFTMYEHDDDIYCKTCHTKNFKPKAVVPVTSPPETNGNMKGKNACPKCGKAVYFAEETIAIGKKWHKMCLKCEKCNRLLNSGSLVDHDGSVYCKTCYGQLFGPKGYGFGGGSAGLSANDTEDHKQRKSSYAEAQAAPLMGRQLSFSSGPKCPRCERTVYFAEEVIAVGEKWHKSCLKCSSCEKTLDPGALQEHKGMPYCKSCHIKSFGPKGYGFAGGSAGLSAHSYGEGDEIPRMSYTAAQGASIRGEESSASVGPKCSRCSKTVYFAEEVIACHRKWHKLCLKCENCNKLLESGSLQEHHGMPYCKVCYGKLFGPKGYGFAGGSAGLSLNRDDNSDDAVVMRNSYAEAQIPRRTSNYSGAPECPRCQLPVYFAEELFAIGLKWHKACLKCNSCGKKLDTSAVNEHDREAYCRACYGRYFGAKGYGFAGGAAGLVGDYDGKIDFSANDNDYEHNGYNGSGDYNGSWAYGGSGDYSGSGDYNGSGEGYECAYNY